ncbi:Protein CBG24333 [Caenorhabditis briggsae]|uniref:Protein CBG24333 n=1 Tax=Caenorhabditis briggsae TaxID=6238 RepID=A8WKH2_CAEBR|nr:Protein CBG24333 [Caenorhabditis briggsae]CAP20967.2 Protein CBG24333 [Caenorhabditis briggsae]
MHLVSTKIPPHTFGEDYLEDLTRAEVIFNPHDREEAWNKVCPKIRQLNEDEYYDWSRNIYWRAIYRQFEGRITFEAALEHLQQCGFDFRIALDTIDQKLHNVPQETRLIPAGRVKTIAALMVKPEVTRRAVQASAMRNWHLPEIQMFWEQFIRFYSRQATFGVGCNCNDPVYMDVAFEPRVGCLVCTRYRRLHADPSKKCLICLTYEKIFEHEKKIQFPPSLFIFFHQPLLHLLSGPTSVVSCFFLSPLIQKIVLGIRKDDFFGRPLVFENLLICEANQAFFAWVRMRATMPSAHEAADSWFEGNIHVNRIVAVASDSEGCLSGVESNELLPKHLDLR